MDFVLFILILELVNLFEILGKVIWNFLKEIVFFFAQSQSSGSDSETEACHFRVMCYNMVCL